MGCVLAELFMEGKALFDLSKVRLASHFNVLLTLDVSSNAPKTCLVPCSCFPIGGESTTHLTTLLRYVHSPHDN